MKVLYRFLDGREQECFLPVTFPLTLMETLIDYSVGLYEVEILSVSR